VSVAEPSPHEGHAGHRLGLGAAVVSVLIGSFAPIILRQSNVAGMTFAFHRLWVAGASLTVLLCLGGRRLDAHTIRLAWPGGVLFGINVMCYFESLDRTSVANTTVIGALLPVVLLFVSNRIFGEKVRRHDISWTAVAVIGVGIVVFAGTSAGSGDVTGDLLAFAAMAAFSGYFVASRTARQSLRTVEYQAALSLVASVTVGVALLVSGRTFAVHDGSNWIWITMMAGVVGTGHLLTNFAQPYVRLTTLSLLNLFGPVGSTLMAWLWLSEGVVALQVVGMAVVIGALAVVVTRGVRAAPASVARRASIAPQPGPRLGDEVEPRAS
jgi:drug/metabolite transporter (DMT)-like permease